MALNGTYRITAQSQMGKTEATFHFKTEGDRLTGTNEVMGQTLQILNGTVTDSTFKFTEKMESQMGAMEFTFSGTYEGDKIAGSFVSQMGTTPFEGRRIG